MELNGCVRRCAFIASLVCFVAWAAKPLAPDFTVKDSTGADLRLSSYKGKVVLLNFWATYCVPCRVEIPWFIEFDKTYHDKGFRVVGISMDDDWEPVKPYLAEKRSATGSGWATKLWRNCTAAWTRFRKRI